MNNPEHDFLLATTRAYEERCKERINVINKSITVIPLELIPYMLDKEPVIEHIESYDYKVSLSFQFPTVGFVILDVRVPFLEDPFITKVIRVGGEERRVFHFDNVMSILGGWVFHKTNLVMSPENKKKIPQRI